MITPVKNFFKKYSIKRAVKKTARALPKAYPSRGKSGRKKYSAGEVLSVMEAKGISPEHRLYLLALFSSHNQFRSYCKDSGGTPDYYELRKEVIVDLFHHNPGRDERQFVRDYDFIRGPVTPRHDNVNDSFDGDDDYGESSFDAVDCDDF